MCSRISPYLSAGNEFHQTGVSPHCKAAASKCSMKTLDSPQVLPRFRVVLLGIVTLF